MDPNALQIRHLIFREFLPDLTLIRLPPLPDLLTGRDESVINSKDFQLHMEYSESIK